eukprot:1025127-Amphidinium_carterae.1
MQHLTWFVNVTSDYRSDQVGADAPHQNACLATWQDVVQDPTSWQPLMQEVLRVAEGRAQATWPVPEGSRIWTMLAPLVPWRLER